MTLNTWLSNIKRKEEVRKKSRKKKEQRKERKERMKEGRERGKVNILKVLIAYQYDPQYFFYYSIQVWF